ncbi:MAG: N-acetylmuramoyl-L-alanine amidase [Lachnospiraceae bacterium]|nr:N-acetylmuramoyl-L-alanine amidase [Lachnospiraceae bacterium]
MKIHRISGLFAFIIICVLFLLLPAGTAYASSGDFSLPCAGVERILSKLSTSYVYEPVGNTGGNAEIKTTAQDNSAETAEESTDADNAPQAEEPEKQPEETENTGDARTPEETGEGSAPAGEAEEAPPEESTPPARSAAPNNRIVCIDAGHQAHANTSKEPIGPGASETKPKVAAGTRGVASGLAEYELTLAVALKLQNILTQRGYTVVMCRTSHDVNLSNSERAQIANNAGAGAFIRLHANGSTSASASGAETLAPSASNPYCASIAAASQALSRQVLNGMCAKSGAKNRGVQIADNMSGINWSQVPVTIVEMGFMTNPSEDLQMADDSYQTKLAEGMADGIDAYFAG